MQSEIKSIIKTENGSKVVTLFGYASLGVPGIEILGLGNKGRLLKEKIIYITRQRGIKLASKKYIISFENIDLKLNETNLNQVEFPVLILLWQLASVIKMNHLNDCICLGEVRVNGDVLQNYLDENELIDSLAPTSNHDWKIVSTQSFENFHQINPYYLLEEIKSLSFKLNYIDKLSAVPIKSTMA